ncbi:isocitrate lyase/PEP mutase family protein [Streptococcus oralis]|uniref:Putative carboxyvinyl-carboxyphosphonate phosphorylmutase n=2 Tax=Streptococcus oralis TaxID=1303 RepID=A0A139NWU7_STROR|nr:isocitrate lyase/phosphoenolpyruvate mutase family protein [Streptococcus oralis]KXT80184.1 putative carboxyvinyl-carboxyphosphonate phosphorylmutase [Streptococcus oralis]
MTDKEKQIQRAQTFQALHKKDDLLLLPNIWNVGSALVFEKEGAKALATSSAGIAFDLGYPDGEDITFDDLLEMVSKICRRVTVPVSVDFERGYAETGAEVKENARKLLEAGAVGVNIEDGCSDGSLSSLDLQLEKIQALVALKEETGIPFVINARTCAFWYDVAGEEENLSIAIERGRAFAQAGADCVFVPGAMSLVAAKTLIQEIPCPLNLILTPQTQDIQVLNQAGLARLSLGSGPVRATYQGVIQLAQKIQQEQDFTALLQTPLTYAKANEYFKE